MERGQGNKGGGGGRGRGGIKSEIKNNLTNLLYAFSLTNSVVLSKKSAAMPAIASSFCWMEALNFLRVLRSSNGFRWKPVLLWKGGTSWFAEIRISGSSQAFLIKSKVIAPGSAWGFSMDIWKKYDEIAFNRKIERKMKMEINSLLQKRGRLNSDWKGIERNREREDKSRGMQSIISKTKKKKKERNLMSKKTSNLAEGSSCWKKASRKNLVSFLWKFRWWCFRPSSVSESFPHLPQANPWIVRRPSMGFMSANSGGARRRGNSWINPWISSLSSLVTMLQLPWFWIRCFSRFPLIILPQVRLCWQISQEWVWLMASLCLANVLFFNNWSPEPS